ncbi:unnamed protein product [Gongylonema pulchrum]|uniref:Transposase n=1 Tax=Gongylonema pulchrum TaxID=637853 RepID=A0A183DJU6_9BILA|nr:unnamed protein product [Gongylonema pulchrum]
MDGHLYKVLTHYEEEYRKMKEKLKEQLEKKERYLREKQAFSSDYKSSSYGDVHCDHVVELADSKCGRKKAQEKLEIGMGFTSVWLHLSNIAANNTEY